jgi:phage shock protein A
MSIATDLRSYADTAVSQGRQFVDQAVEQAQAQLNDVTGQANELFGKGKEIANSLATNATATVTDLRTQAEKAINLDAVRTAVEPYLAQVKGYGQDLGERAESLVGTVKSDPRVAKLVEAAGVVVETVQEKVVKPVQSLAGRGAKPATKPSTKPAATKPAAKSAATKPATKPAATKPAATKPAARKAPAKRAAKS